MELEAGENAVIRFSSLQGSASASLRDIMDKGFICPMGGLNLQLEMGAAVEDIPVEQYETTSPISNPSPCPLPKENTPTGPKSSRSTVTPPGRHRRL